MGEILASFTYSQSAKFWTPRSYFKGVAFGWVPGWTVTAEGNPFLLLEHSFGGYQVFCRFKTDWYAWQSNDYTMDFPLEDFYAIAPITGAHVSVGLVLVGLGFSALYPSWYYTLEFFPTPEYKLFNLPPGPPDYWLGALP